MKNLLKSLLIIVLSADPVIWLYLRLRNKTPRIILYHGVSDDPTEAKTSQAMACGMFKKQLRYLSHHYTNLSLEQTVAIREKKQTCPQNAITLTFDDGYRNNYDFAVPLLLEHGFTATFFINPKNAELAEQGRKSVMWWDIMDLLMDAGNMGGFAAIFKNYGHNLKHPEDFYQTKVEMEETLKEMDVENNERITEEIKTKYVNGSHMARFPAFMSWKQLNAIIKAGMSIGAHTLSHVTVSKLPKSRYAEELVKAKAIMEEKLGVRIDYFAFPYGGGKHYSKASLDAVKRAGYRCALLVLSGQDRQEDDPICFNRTSIHKTDDFRTFKIKAAGIYDDLKIVFRNIKELWLKRN